LSKANLIPESSASSASCCGFFKNVDVGYCLYVNSCGTNSGGSVCSPVQKPFLGFGIPGTGEGISSDRTGSVNKNGLCLWTAFKRRITITNCGKVGIGTASPGATLCVQGVVAANGVNSTVSCATALTANSCTGPGVNATSLNGFGVQASSHNPIVEKIQNTACSGDKSALLQFETGCSANWNIGVAGGCNSLSLPKNTFYIEQGCSSGIPRVAIDSCGSIHADAGNKNAGTLRPGPGIIFGCVQESGVGIASNRTTCKPNLFGLDFYTDSPSSKPIPPRMSITNDGNVGIRNTSPETELQVCGTISGTSMGIGTSCCGGKVTCPETTLRVQGSFAAKAAAVSADYSMTATDFAILASAASGEITVTLPPAKTASGMIVFVKKVDSSTNEVLVKAVKGNKIEAKASSKLAKEYSSLTLISDGSSNWYILANGS
jgi:hypothetical protein